MGAMTIADAWPSTARPFTTDDLDRMPADGHRFELRDGSYEQAAHVLGDEPFRTDRPFSVEVVPSRLVAGLLS